MSRAETMIRLAGLLILLLLVSKPAISVPLQIVCSKVIASLSPCLDYVQDKTDEPSPACCSGVNGLADLVKTKEDRIAVCECVKKALSNIKYDAGRIPGLPMKCGFSFTFPPVDPGTNCSKVL
ncbi:non-specific lipid-transfer protein-like [Hevea brasiliensis]|uniref:non-specific lipid-transfer protein-like n=1 Tax=Hevea brasiliensis TaxID=3981 RepID=UPI0025EE1E3C|nr:non-specific lipid-transfer protein-like [Hevea brasiliensis]